jgi:signal peptidase I
MEGDIIMWAPTPIQDVQPGDIIIFNSRVSWPENRLVSHRVIEVDNKGQSIYLTTKGDANTWADQYGPHIPEPKISKENYIGTIITFGSLPIKIPLLGNIGIYLLEGLNVLSQAARAKDTIAYLGIFLPVTISIILLFLSLLLIPDKAKTIIEKIRALILREKGIPLKEMVSMLLICFFLLSTCTHIFAYDSFEANIGINESPKTNTFSFGQIEPGQNSFPKHIPLINPGVMPLHGFVIADSELTDLVNRQTFYLAPGEDKQVNITASTSYNTQTGIYYGSIKIYSSALWLFIPQSLIENIISTAPLHSVYILDFISAVFFTTISILVMFIILIINYQRQAFFFKKTMHPKKLPKYTKYIDKIIIFIYTPFQKVFKKTRWISSAEFQYPQPSYLLLALITSIIFGIILHFDYLLIFLVPFITTTSTYFLGNKTRQQIISTTIYSCITVFTILALNILYPLFTTSAHIMHLISQILGVLSTYLLLIGIILIPASLLMWIFITLLQNLKESINPLHQLEGHCNL